MRTKAIISPPTSVEGGPLRALCAVWLVCLSLYFLVMSISPLLPELMGEFRLSHSMGGFVYALPVLMIALLSYPLGILSDRFGMRASIGTGASIVILSAILRALTQSFDLFIVYTAVFGFGFALCFPNLPKFVKETFPPRLSGTATGAYTTAIPLGAGLALLLTRPILAASGNWRHALLVWCALSIPSALVWWLSSLPGKGQRRKALEAVPWRQAASKEEMREHPSSGVLLFLALCGLVLALLNLIFYCTIGWLPTYLIERGWSAGEAATATSFISFIEIPAMFLLPLLSDRTGRRRLIVFLSLLVLSAGSAVLSSYPSLTWLAVPALGVTCGGVFSLLLSLPVELVEAKRVGRTAGAIISIGYVGALVGPPAAGHFRDLTGNFSGAFFATAIIGLMAAGLSLGLPSSGRAARE